MSVKSYRDLIAWQKAMDLSVGIYCITEAFPPREHFGLSNQMRRASVSIPSNIAEGQGRGTTKDYVHFLHIARGSLQELETQLLLAQRLAFASESEMQGLLARLRRSQPASVRPHEFTRPSPLTPRPYHAQLDH